jgi:hypothetical protein
VSLGACCWRGAGTLGGGALQDKRTSWGSWLEAAMDECEVEWTGHSTLNNDPRAVVPKVHLHITPRPL